jgi:hypothetical protein
VIVTGGARGEKKLLERRRRRYTRMQIPKKSAVMRGEVHDEVIVDMFTGSECRTCGL